MQYEANRRRPGNKPPGPVMGFPSQQKAQQRPGSLSGFSPSRPTSPSPAQRPGTTYKKPGIGPVAGPQRFANAARRPSSGNTGLAKKTFPGQQAQPGFKGANAGRSAGSYPVSSAVKNRFQNNSTAPGKIAGRFKQGPQMVQSVSGSYFPAQAMGSVIRPVSYQPSYVFNPAPDIPPKMPSGNGGNTIPNPHTVPDDFPDKQPCTCGQTGNGCTMLSGFAVGSAVLTPAHKQQIVLLAQNILQTNIKAVTTTGHTDVTGSDENNMYLGNERSTAVRKELKNTLHRLKPWSQTAIYFRTDTKGESEPVSDTDDGLNRRVEVCLQQVP